MSIIPSDTATRKAMAAEYLAARNSVLPRAGVTVLQDLARHSTKTGDDVERLATAIGDSTSGSLYIGANLRDPEADLGAGQGGVDTLLDSCLVLADIDIGKDEDMGLRYARDEDEAQSAADIIADMLGTDPVTVVRTRNGLAALYCITGLTRDLAHAADRAVAAALATEGLQIDRGVLANPATLTRPAGSLHQKPGNDEPIVNVLRSANPGACTSAEELATRIAEYVTPPRPRMYQEYTALDTIPMADLLNVLGFEDTGSGWAHPDGSSETRDAAIYTGDDGMERVHIFSTSVADTLLDAEPGSYTSRWLLKKHLSLNARNLDALADRLDAEGVDDFLDELAESPEAARTWLRAGGWPDSLSDRHITHLARHGVTAAQARRLGLASEERPRPDDDSDNPTAVPAIVGTAPSTAPDEDSTIICFPRHFAVPDETFVHPAAVLGSANGLVITTSLCAALTLQDTHEVVLVGDLATLIRQPGMGGNRSSDPKLSYRCPDPRDRDVCLALGPEWRRNITRARDAVLALRAAGAASVALHDTPRDPVTRVRRPDQMQFSTDAADEAVTVGAFDPTTRPGLLALLADRISAAGHRFDPARRAWLVDDGTRLCPADGAPAGVAAEIIDDIFGPDDRRAPTLAGLNASWLPAVKPDLNPGPLDEATSDLLARNDDHPYRRYTPKGLLDLRTGQTYPRPTGTPNTRCMRAHPRPVGPDEDLLTTTVAGNLLLDMCRGDRETAGVLQEALSRSLLGLPSEKIYMIVDAQGNAGKSTLLRAVTDNYGDYSVQLSATAFAGQDGRFATAKLAGACLVVASELGADTRMTGQDIKRLATRDRVPAEHKGGKHFDFVPQYTVIVTTNHLPQLRGFDTATADRIVVIDVHPIPADQRDAQLSTRLAQDAAGTAALLLAGAQRIIARLDQGVPEHKVVPLTPAVVETTARYRRQEDHLARWLAEHTTHGVDGEATAVRTVRDEFVEYMKDEEGVEDYRAPSKARFIQNLSRCGVDVGEIKPGNGAWRVSKRDTYAKGLVLQAPDTPRDLTDVVALDDYRKASKPKPAPMTATGETVDEGAEFDV